MFSILAQFGFVLGLAMVISLVMRYLKQPLIIGYILAGLLISAGLSHLVNLESLSDFSHIGVALLLFIVGLGLNPRIIKETGLAAIATGLGQIIFTSLIGFFLSLLLGFDPIASLYLAVAFTFSSTVIILSLLHIRRDEETLYGRISIGFLIIQDLVAMLILVAVSLVARLEGGADIYSAISLVIFNFSWLTLTIFALGAYIIPHIDRIFARHTELLTLFALSLCFGFAALFDALEFSMELGALLAGVVLASSPYQREIAARVRPLRDFFLVIFFVALGSSLDPSSIGSNLFPALLFSAFILIGNPLIVIVIMRFLGYSHKTGFMAGLTVAQISEFSLILLALGVSLGHIQASLISLGTLVGLITIAGSSYLISYATEAYAIFQKLLPHFEFLNRDTKSKKLASSASPDIILFGAHRLGGGLATIFKKKKYSFLTIDHDPFLVRDFEKKNIPVEFGEVDDWEFLSSLPLNKSKLIISTVPNIESNLVLLRYARSKRLRAPIITVANYKEHATELYAAGAAYVVVPPYLGRRYMSDLVISHGFSKTKYQKEKDRYLKELN